MKKKKKKHSIIACVSLRYTSEQIIRTAHTIAAEEDASLTVVTVFTGPPTEEQLEIAEHFRSAAGSVGAAFTILFNENPALAVVDYIKRTHTTHVITGSPLTSSPDGSRFISLLRSVYPKEVTVIPVPAYTTFVTDAVCTLPLQLMLGSMQQTSAEKKL
ncbi:MAG: hypothetical protein E7559_04080 [Ruminococcaceae bacterium]|nr:hypothetical protein [Oscillospiraceae bacterium]